MRCCVVSDERVCGRGERTGCIRCCAAVDEHVCGRGERSGSGLLLLPLLLEIERTELIGVVLIVMKIIVIVPSTKHQVHYFSGQGVRVCH